MLADVIEAQKKMKLFAMYTFGWGWSNNKKKLIGLNFKEWQRFLYRKNVGQNKSSIQCEKWIKIVKNGFCYIAKSIKI